MDDHGHIGEVSQNKFGTLMKIIVWNAASDIQVQFQDDHMAVVHTTYRNFQKREVKNPYDKSVFGVGCLGVGKYKTRINGVRPQEYQVWRCMLQRCYGTKWSEHHSAYYDKCTVCDEWLNYQNFAAWYCARRYDVRGRLHLDKDILFFKNTVYSPETCLLVPQRINMIFMAKHRTVDMDLPTGIRRIKRDGQTWYSSTYNAALLGVFDSLELAYEAYTVAKHTHIRQVLDEYKDILPADVYFALANYHCPRLKELME